MIIVSLQPVVFRWWCKLVLFVVLLRHHVSADLVVRDNVDIEQHITPRLFSQREEVIPTNNGCCPLSDGCCGASCTEPGGACCPDGTSCPAGSGCCGALNIGNNDCAPLDSSCCRNGGYCERDSKCCNNGGCAPMGAECCETYGYCHEGTRCVTYRGLQKCCPGGICGGGGGDSGYVYSAPPAAEGSAGAPAITEERTVVITAERRETITAELRETVNYVRTETVSSRIAFTDTDGSTPTEQTFSMPTRSASFPSVTLPAIASELDFAPTSRPDGTWRPADEDRRASASSRINALSTVLGGGNASAGALMIPGVRWLVISTMLLLGLAVVS